MNSNSITSYSRTHTPAQIPEQFNKFKDLIYCPLDLREPPAIDVEDLLNWSKSVSPNHPNQSGKIVRNGQTILTPEQSIRDQFGYYPWLSIWLKRNPDFVPENNGWMKDFVDRYPALVEYFSEFPVKEVLAVNLIWQYNESSVMIHTDPEHWFGMRLYIANEEDSPVYFMKTKEKVDTRYDYATTDHNDSYLNTIVDQKRHYVKYLKPYHPWILNNVRAFHGVEKNTHELGKRAVILIHGRFKNNESPIDFDKLYNILERSVDKYREYCIWY